MKLLRKIRALFQKPRLDREMAEEMRAHVELQAQTNLKAGMAPDEARYAARRQFGGVEQIKERARDQRGFVWFDHLFQDVRFGARILRKNPGFALVAIASLALGIAVNLVMFSLINAVVFRPLPGVSEPERIVNLSDNGISYAEFEYCRKKTRSFAGLAASTTVESRVSLEDPAAPHGNAATAESFPCIHLASGNYFSVLGIKMELGRAFRPEEDRVPGAHPVLVLSHAYWAWRFQSDPHVIGKILRLNDVAFTVIGVARDSFVLRPDQLPGPFAWAPMMMSNVLDPGRGGLDSPQRRVGLFGRLNPGVSFGQAKAELASLDTSYAKAYLHADSPRESWPMQLNHGFAFAPWRMPDIKVLVIGVLLLAAIVPLVACANLANLLLARATTRQREISVRLALGASRGQVVRQLLTESLMLAGAGSAVGLLVAAKGGELLWPRVLGLSLPPSLLQLFGLDAHMAFYALGLAFVTGVIFGLVPALEAAKSGIHSGLKQENAIAGFRVSRSRLRRFLVTGQIAVSVTFLIVASLMMRVVLRWTASSVAFDTRRVFWVESSAPPGSSAAQHPREFQRALLERLRALPGVQSASLAEVWYGRDIDGSLVLFDDHPPRTSARINESRVSPDYFATLGVPLVSGRYFTVDDMNNGAPVFVISESFARQFWPDENPLGRRLRLGPEMREGKVIGVVKDGVRMIRTRWNREQFAGDLYSPLPQNGTKFSEIWIRTGSDPAGIIGTLPEQAQELDKSVLVQPRGPLSGFLEEWQHLMLMLSGIGATLGGLALLVSVTGVYGVMAYAVAQRTHEIGVRMALGASSSSILRLILGEGVRLVAWGVVIGAAGCAGAAYLLRAFLYGLSPVDPVTFGGISLILGGVALLACWFPARAATKVDPMVALRCE